jgi:hypothetical protein
MNFMIMKHEACVDTDKPMTRGVDIDGRFKQGLAEKKSMYGRTFFRAGWYVIVRGLASPELCSNTP